MVELPINGRPISASPDHTIPQVCRDQGLDNIPTLCYDPKLPPFGSCFLCVVEVEGQSRLFPACSTKVSAGMKIMTRSEKVVRARKTCLELLLSDHYADCFGPCRLNCPADVDIQGYMSLINLGKFKEAIALIKDKNPLPSVCGRVCTRLNIIQVLFLFVVVMLYHLNVLRTDGASMADTLEKKQSAFSVLIVDSGAGFVDAVKAALMKSGAKVQVTVTTADKKPEGDFSAVILSGSLAGDAPAWIKSFGGKQVIVQNEALNLVWAEDAGQAAESVQRMAEGQEVQKKNTTRSALTYVIYIFAALFALQLLFMLLAFGISLVTGF